MVSALARTSAILAATCFAQFSHADSIVLRSSVRTDSDTPLLLREIANLEGPDAVALGGVVVLEASKPGNVRPIVTLSIEEVRSVISASRPQTRWGRIAFNGDSCTVRLIEPKQEAAEPAAKPVAPAATEHPVAPGPTWRLASELAEENVRGTIAGRLVRFLKVEPETVRLNFAESDATLLDMPGAGRVLDVQPTGLGTVVPVLVRVFEGERVIAAGTVKVRVEQQQHVVVCGRSLRRGDIVAKDGVLVEDRWVAPGARYLSESSVIGNVVKNRLEPGQVFVEGDVEAALLVKRGDIVNLACLSGSIVMNTKARALTQGREGEVIEFVSLRNAKSRVTAKVIAPGQAVIQAQEPEDQVFRNEPAADPAPPTDTPSKPVSQSPFAPAQAQPMPQQPPTQVQVGSVKVEKVVNNADGTFVVHAKTDDPRRPVKKMKFTPIEVP